MSLPPDPHDDDLAGYATPQPPPPPPPPPPSGAGGGVLPPAPGGTPPGPSGDGGAVSPPPGPATDAAHRGAPAAPAPPTGPPPPSPSATPGGSGTGGADTDRTAAHRVPQDGGGASTSPPTGSGRRKLGLVLAGVAALVALAGVATLTLTGDDDADTASADTEQSADESDQSDGAGDSESAAPGADAPVDDGTGAGDDDTDAQPGDGDDEAGGMVDETPDRSDATPVEVAEEFFLAIEAGDCAGMIALMTPESYGPDGETADAAIAECESDAAGTAAVAAAAWDDVELVSEAGDEAVITVTMTGVGGRESAEQLPLRRVDGEWFMDLVASPLGG